MRYGAGNLAGFTTQAFFDVVIELFHNTLIHLRDGSHHKAELSPK